MDDETPAAARQAAKAACEAFWRVRRGRDGLRNDPTDAWPWAQFQQAEDAWQAAVDAAAAVQQPQPAAEPGSLTARVAAEFAGYEADIASLTDQRNRVSDTADRLRAERDEAHAENERLRGWLVGIMRGNDAEINAARMQADDWITEEGL